MLLARRCATLTLVQPVPPVQKARFLKISYQLQVSQKDVLKKGL